MSAPKVIIEVDLEAAERLIERSVTLLPAKDAEELCRYHHAVVEMVRLLQERGTTIVRLRRLFGLAKSEKTAAVLGQEVDSASLGEDGASAAEPAAEDTTLASPAVASGAAANDAAASQSSGTAEGAGPAGAEKKKGHGRTAASAYKDATQHFVSHDQLQPGYRCPGGCGGKVRDLEKPAVTIRIKGHAPFAADLWQCQRLRCDTCGDVFTAKQPPDARGEKYDESAAAMLGTLHYVNGMPFFRLDRLMRQLGTPIPASTQWEILRDRSRALLPVFQELVRQGAQGSLLYTDDTCARVLEFLGKRRAALLAAGELAEPERTGIFTTGMVSTLEGGKLAILYATGRAHAGENLDQLLDERSSESSVPMHMSDGLSRNGPRRHKVVDLRCLSHGRRGIVDQVGNFPREVRVLLENFGVVFKNDAEARKKGMSPEERLRFHRGNSGLALSKVKKTINTLLRGQVEESSAFGKALVYVRKRWRAMTQFLRIPGAPLTNNLCERVLKLAILYRKNSYFYRSAEGAMVGDIYMSLLHTACVYGENPVEYLTALLLHEKDAKADPSAWMPWTVRSTLAWSAPELRQVA